MIRVIPVKNILGCLGELDLLETFTLSTFNEGDSFVVYGDGDPIVELLLEQIIPGKHKMPEAVRDPFSLIFKGPRTVELAQRSYQMKHGALGLFELFIVPTDHYGEDRQFIYYEACFS